MPSYGSIDVILPELRAVLGERLDRSADVRRHHGADEGWNAPVAPEAVGFPISTDEVARLVGICAAGRVPVIPFGAGTSFEGGVAALHGGLCLDLSGMDRILEVNEADLDCTVEAGVRRTQLEEYLGPRGLFFAVDPGADATIGGMAATRASGTQTVGYGAMREAVLSVSAVMADGQVIRTARRARKSSAGYDLTHLLVGSEGTLGVITEVTLRVYGIPEATVVGICAFATLGGAVETAIATMQMGIRPARMELLDEVQVAACNAYSDLDLPTLPTLLFEFHGTPAGVAEQAEAVRSIAGAHGGGEWQSAGDETGRRRLWKIRHEAYYAVRAQRPGVRGMPTDVCVPISRLAECIVETRRDLDASGIYAPMMGHVGDGNFHVTLTFDPDDLAELAACRAFHDRLVRRALAMGGTCTGEHGIGYGKQAYLVEEHGPAVVDVMRAVKRALDPLNIMNPGKVIPPE
jgi:D-lactate dehydrogenase (cytochrome)